MLAGNNTDKKILLLILRDFSKKHTISTLADKLKLSRVGIWKIVKKLASKKYIILVPVGEGRTNMSLIRINWDNILVEKSFALFLTEESIQQRRWRVNFKELEQKASFSILYGSILQSPKTANDIDILHVCKKNKFLDIQNSIDKIQKVQEKKVHAINFTETELMQELNTKNKAFIEVIKKGVVLFGQEHFVEFMKKVHE